MSILKILLYSVMALTITCIGACNKNELLNEKPVSTLNNPNTVEELQEMLDYSIVLNTAPGLGDVSADNYFITSVSWAGLPVQEQNAYVWAKEIFNSQGNAKEWNGPYEQVFYSNVILGALQSIPANNYDQTTRDKIKGMALFIRGNAFYNLAQLFSAPYDSATAAFDPGLPLRLTENILDKSVRSPVQKTYEQIISDVSESCKLLPISVDQAHPNRASRPAAMALLARIYLSMRLYKQAGMYADSCLKLYNKLLDYNTVKADQFFPFKGNNPEIIFYSEVTNAQVLMAIVNKNTFIDSGLYRLYDANDLRRSLFYNISNNGQPFIKSSYTGNLLPFAGLATDEMILIRAECKARAGEVTAAMDDLNTLLQYRYKLGTFNPLTATTIAEALEKILPERRKELPFRNLRWTDLRRLNKEHYNIHLKRIINGSIYELSPGHIRYVLPIPPDVIMMSKMPQNPR